MVLLVSILQFWVFFPFFLNANTFNFWMWAGCERDVNPTCSERGEDEPVVQRLRGSVVVLQQHPVRLLHFAGVKYRFQLQELQWRTNNDNLQTPSSEAESKNQQAKEKYSRNKNY